eukprot:scaffold1780_cov189-Chaetoceros_neogracile.AAC.1
MALDFKWSTSSPGALSTIRLDSTFYPKKELLKNAGSAAATTSNTIEGGTFIIPLDSVECTVSKVLGLTPPGAQEVPVQYECTTDDDDALFFDYDATPLLGNDFESGETRLTLAPQAMTSDGKIS